MKVYNKEKTQMLTDYDLEKGYLVNDKILKEVLQAQEEVKEQGHYKTIKEYPNGGKTVEWVVDIQGKPARPETPVYEDIQVYVPYTEKEIATIRIEKLKQNLSNEDFKTIKYIQGKLSKEEFDAVVVQCDEWRKEINELEVKYGII